MTSLEATEELARIAGGVEDPELPTVTIGDLGILRGVAVDEAGHVEVSLTPTYSGCPAVEVIERDVLARLAAAGWDDVTVRRVLSPAWTTDWITPAGRRKLAAGGIAPPDRAGRRPAPGPGTTAVPVAFVVLCPRCGSRDTELVSRFGSTPCKALRRCRSCSEPFDHFKAL